ncbi:MAG: NAD(P)-dependent alcohol dehydrogenase [Candidatus Limnocylindria bacterium]
MQAIVQDRYGPIDVLQLRDIDKPAIGEDEVLVRVRAASLHVGDLFGVRGSPFPVRMMSGLLRPRVGVPGFDIAGQVESVGGKVTRFRPGDEVFGVGIGACAEYARAAEDKLLPKPVDLTWEQAAAIPTSGLAALNGLRDAGKLQPGQRVLINGASGGVGTFAIQITKALGAEVTAVCSTRNVDLVRSLGADHVIDYTREDFTTGEARYDLIFDNVENRSLAECRRVLAPSGTLVLNSGTGAGGLRMLARLVWPLVLSSFTSHTLRRYLSNPIQADLVALTQLVEDGKVRPVIGRTYPLSETPAALRHIESGHARGKVVVTV